MKKVFLTLLGITSVCSIAFAQDEDDIMPPVRPMQMRVQEVRADISTDKNVVNHMSNNLTTGDQSIDEQVRSLIQERDNKVKVIMDEYQTKIKAIIGDLKLKFVPPNNSTPTGMFRYEDMGRSDEASGTPMGRPFINASGTPAQGVPFMVRELDNSTTTTDEENILSPRPEAQSFFNRIQGLFRGFFNR